MLKKSSKYLIPFLLFLSIIYIYIHNLSQSVYGGDVGDLVTAAFTGGVAHPSGYPLFVFLGFLLTRMHFFLSPAFTVGLISAFSGALGVVLFYFTVKLLTKGKFIAIISSLILAFTYFFWFYSEIADVFALNSFFLIALLFLVIKIIQEKSFRLFPLFFFILGLSLTNHQSIVLAFPSIFLLQFPFVLQQIRKKKINFSIVLKSFIAFIAGLLVYLYIPIASVHHPVINWDNVKDIQSFLHLILRKDYGTFSAGFFPSPSFLQRIVSLKTYFLQILVQLTIPVVTISIIGVIFSFFRNRLLTISLLIGFIISGPLFICYAGFPLTGNFYLGVNERFFLLSVVFLLYFFPFGLLFLSQLFEKYLNRSAVLLQVVFLIIPIMLFFYNFPKTNLSNVFVGDTYAQDILYPLPKNAILFLGGDTIIFNVWYEQYVLGIRSDVHSLNINGNVGSPYYAVLEEKYKKQNPHASNSQMQQGIIQELPEDGSVFSVEQLNKGKWIPYGLLLRLISTQNKPTEEQYTKSINAIWSHFHIPYASHESLGSQNVTIADIPTSYANSMLVTGSFYLSEYKDYQKAKEWYLKAIAIKPTYDKIYSSLGVLYLTEKQCVLAKKSFDNAIGLNPTTSLNYLLEYVADIGCLKDLTAAGILKKQFENEFQIPFTTAYKNFLQKK